MKIMLLSGASSVHTIRWANAFHRRGEEVHLVTQHDPIDKLDAGVWLHRLPHHHGAGYLTNQGRLRSLVRELGVDVVNAHYATGYGTLARAVMAVPLVLNVWGSDVYDFPECGPLHRALVRRNLRRADKVVSTSHAMARRTAAICPGIGTITVVPFGVDMDLFQPRGTVEAGHAPVIGTVKSLAPKYGIDTLIEAFALLVPAHPGLRLRIVGSGPQETELKELSVSLGVGDRIDWVGRVGHAEVPDELRKMDVYAALSKLDSESFGVAVIEASACGVPVVVSDVGGLPEVVVQDATGFVVPRSDPSAAAQKIELLLYSPEIRERMGGSGRKHVLSHYEWDNCVDRMLEVLRSTKRERDLN